MRIVIRKEIFVALIIGFAPFHNQTSLAQTKAPHHYWWNQPYVSPPPKDPTGSILPLISVKGTRFIDATGDTVVFRGIAISDPDKLETQGHWNKAHFAKVKDMGANIVRVPIHPIAWRERTPAVYLKLLDQAVAWCTELGMYVMIDWHSIGNLKMGLFQRSVLQHHRAGDLRVLAHHCPALQGTPYAGIL